MLRTQILNCRPNERGRFLWCWLGIAIGDDLNDTAIAEIINAVAYRVAKFNDGVLARRIGQVLVPQPGLPNFSQEPWQTRGRGRRGRRCCGGTRLLSLRTPACRQQQCDNDDQT